MTVRTEITSYNIVGNAHIVCPNTLHSLNT